MDTQSVSNINHGLIANSFTKPIMGNSVRNYPNARKLAQSLRHLGYETITAIKDLLDNSLDADADLIRLLFFGDGENNVSKVMIVDNGCGMDLEVLDEALRLGSDIEKNPSCDLGLYGMGLVTASIAIGRKLTVITKTEDGEILHSVQDLDEVYAKNEFVKTLNLADRKTCNYFYSLLGKEATQGTIVILETIDNCNYKFSSAFMNRLIADIGQSHRKFIATGRKIFVQDIELKPIDPIYDFDPIILCKDKIKLNDNYIDIVIAELQDQGKVINRNEGVGVLNQGFYILRNNREILTGQTLGIFTKHPKYNLLRVEFSYPGILDKELSSNFQKSKITINQSLKDKLEALCSPYIKQVEKHVKERSKSNKNIDDSFKPAEKHITQKSHLLQKPKVDVPKPRTKSTEPKEPKEPKETKPTTPRVNIKIRPRVKIDANKVRFELKKLGVMGPLYDVDMDRNVVVIGWNEDHLFYEEVILPNLDNPDVLNPMAFFVYCLGLTELETTNDSEIIMIQNRLRVGMNLASLMK